MPEYKVDNLYSGTKVDTGSLCAHSSYYSSVTVHRFVTVAKLMFLMASDRKKWSNYVHSCISGTHGTHAVVPGQAPSSDSPSEK